MMNPPLEQQLLAGIEERNDVISAQYKRIEELEQALRTVIVAFGEYSEQEGETRPGKSFKYWSPAGRMMDTDIIAKAQQALKEQP